MIEIYTDGAVTQGNIGWGFVAIQNSMVVHELFGELKGEPSLLFQRNVAGEMAAVIRALAWAKRKIRKGELSVKEVKIVHDYSGCSAWPDGLWKAKNGHTQRYARYVNKCRKEVKISFKLVKGHGKNKSLKDNTWNDRADVLAKAGAQLAYKNNNKKSLT